VNAHGRDAPVSRIESLSPPRLYPSSAEPQTPPPPSSYSSEVATIPSLTGRRAGSASRLITRVLEA
jgi:hypothetical protein